MTPSNAAPPAAAPMFNCAARFVIELKRQKILAPVRYPSDEEWAARQRSIKTIVQNIGPGASTTRAEGVDDADLEMYNLIREDGAPDLDAATASLVIQRLNRADPDEPTFEGELLRIPLTVPGAKTEHLLRVPSEVDLRKYRKAAYTFIDRRHGKQELKSYLPAIADFYDKLVAEPAAGYTGAVPLPHKVAVVVELVATLDAEDNEQDPSF
jgi:hypothetical protein